jgi:hypothetical protein
MEGRPVRQQNLTGSGFEKYCKKSHKGRFLDDMEQLIYSTDSFVSQPFSASSGSFSTLVTIYENGDPKVAACVLQE